MYNNFLFMMITIFFVGLVHTTVFAGPIEDAKAALDRKDFGSAFNLLKPLADQGNAEAQALVGEMYYNGLVGGKQNYTEALKWLLKAGGQGNISAEDNLGFFYSSNDNGMQDYAQAAIWYAKAAQQGDSSAQDNLGWQYSTGHGVTQNTAIGKQWFLKSANQGNFDAMSHLVDLYDIDNNNSEQYFWKSILAKSNSSWAQTRDFAASQLTPEQKAAVDQRLQEWKPVPSVVPTK